VRHRIFFFSILLISACPALAGPREDTLAGISRCAGLPDDHLFLDCVYGAAQPMRARLGLSPALAAQQRLVPPAETGAARDLPPRTDGAVAPSGGFLSRLAGAGPDLHMTAYSFDKRGLFTVTLSDGEVWRQDSSDSNFAHFGGKASNYPVTIVQGDFGKSRLDVRGEPGPYIVDRIK
jgi:hypothetical protein